MTDSKAKPKAKVAECSNKPRKLATKPKSPPKASAKPKPPASDTKPRIAKHGDDSHATARVKRSGQASEESASRLIDQRIRELGDWRGQTLARMRALILEADSEVTEEWKWTNPVWSHNGIICTGEAYKKVVKLTFARGASIPDPSRLFNSSLEGKTRRAIDIHESETVDPVAFQALVQAAVALNGSSAKKSKLIGASSAKPSSRSTQPGVRQSKPLANDSKPIKVQKGEKSGALLSGGNPQIAKADGDAPVQAYIAAMPGWKSQVGKRLDALIVRSVPNVRKAVKWNSPFYGIEGQGWFLSFHVFTHFVKVTFFNGASLRPLPPGGTERSKEARWIDIRQDDQLDEAQMASWLKQAASLPGWLA